MKKGILNIIALLNIVTASYGSNVRMLADEAKSCSSKIWSNKTINQEDIKESLTFLNNLQKINLKYKDSNVFNSLVSQAKTNIETIKDKKSSIYKNTIQKSINLSRFINLSQEIYTLSNDDHTKIGIHLLTEAIIKQYLSDLKKLEKIETVKSQNSENQENKEVSPKNNRDVVDYLLTIDKNIIVK